MGKIQFRRFLFWGLLVAGSLIILEALSFTCLTVLDLTRGRTFSQAWDSRAGELVMAWSDPVYFGDYDPLTQVRHVPGANYHGLPVNEHGFIGNGHTNPRLNSFPEKPEGVFRIIMLGGSTTAGLGVRSNSQTIAAFLERKLNVGEASTYQVLNFGFPGGCTGGELAAFLLKLVHIEPDAVICLDGFNDVWNAALEPRRQGLPHPLINWSDYSYGFFEFMNGRSRHSAVPWKVFTHTSALILRARQSVASSDKADFYNEYPHYQLSKNLSNRNPFLTNVSEKNLDAMAAYCSRNDILLLAYLQPWALNGKKDLSAEEQRHVSITVDLMARLGVHSPQELARLFQPGFNALEQTYSLLEDKYQNMNGVRFMDVGDAFVGVRGDVYHDMVHLTAQGNEIMARRMGADLLDLKSRMGSEN